MYRQMAIFDVRIVAELFADVGPRTAKNFCALCTGDKMGKRGKPLDYKSPKFRRVIPGFKLQNRDFSRNAGTSGESESLPGEKITAEDTRQESQTDPEEEEEAVRMGPTRVGIRVPHRVCMDCIHRGHLHATKHAKKRGCIYCQEAKNIPAGTGQTSGISE